MIIKGILYGAYMLNVRVKAIKHSWIKKYKGQEEADKYAQKTAYLWAKYTIKTIGIDLEVKGLENIPDEACVFIGNHTSILDIPIMFYTIDRLVGFVAKKEMLKAPVIGTWLEKAHCIPLDRENPREAIKTINYGVELLKKGYSLAIFPEGTRSKDGNIGEFKKGSLKLATKAKAPIVPIAIDRAYTSFEKDKKFKPSKIKVTFGNAISTAELTKEEEKTLNEDVRNIIKSYLS
ncbi:1-acyl-sn-glycerol-3-phosphate acyltransferase [Clostridium disporicum]|uniref:1-acyl-sn-glycerol-3-phosphate acyltransferase n=2 Tax=Clostridiaceae TaxID=31979 RepID=A0A174JTN8_9CLOT|nr:1-acyl-sn-glycerol-3-phosphate acyltransferase [Clostridium disporicum]